MSRRRNKRNRVGGQIGLTYGYPTMTKKKAAGAATPNSQIEKTTYLNYTPRGRELQ